jgi:hypothetical protein
MNQEKMQGLFPGQKKIEEEAYKINEKVDEYFANPRTKKNKTADEVAHEAIKKEKSRAINIDHLPKNEKEWYENLREAGITVLSDGFMEIPRWDNTGENFNSPKKIIQKVDGINSAIRMQDHIITQYRIGSPEKESEMTQLESIQEVIESANDILTRWKKAPAREKESLKLQLATVILQLENCKNEYKVRTKDHAEKTMSLKDSLGRENPGALAARTVAALNNLAKRINEVQLIEPIMALRKENLILEKNRIGYNIRKSKAILNGIIHHSVFSTNREKSDEPRIRENEVEILDRKIGQALHHLDSIRVLPYSQQSEQARFFLMYETKKSFSSRKKLIENRESVKESLLKTITILESNLDDLG